MNGKTGQVDWRTFLLVIGIGSTILGVLWNQIAKVQDDITDIKIDVAGTRSDLNNLIRRINGGEITIKRNER